MKAAAIGGSCSGPAQKYAMRVAVRRTNAAGSSRIQPKASRPFVRMYSGSPSSPTSSASTVLVLGCTNVPRLDETSMSACAPG